MAVFIMAVAAGKLAIGRAPVGINAAALPSSLAGVSFLYAPAQVITLKQSAGKAQVVAGGAILTAVQGVAGINWFRQPFPQRHADAQSENVVFIIARSGILVGGITVIAVVHAVADAAPAIVVSHADGLHRAPGVPVIFADIV